MRTLQLIHVMLVVMTTIKNVDAVTGTFELIATLHLIAQFNVD